MKCKAPAYQVYPADDLVDWLFWTNSEVGAAERLKRLIWKNDEVSMEEFDRIGIDLTAESKLKVLKKFVVEGDRILHDDLKLQKKNHEAFRKMQAEKSRKFWKQKRKSRQPVDDPVDIPRDGPIGNQRETSYSYSYSESETKNKNKREKSDYDKKGGGEEMLNGEVRTEIGETNTNPSGGDGGQQMDKPESNGSLDDRPEAVQKFLANIKAPKRAAPIVGTWGEDDPAPQI